MSKADEIRNMLQQLGEEVAEEEHQKLSEESKKLHRIARTLLTLERDLNVPGAKKSQEERVERLLGVISKEAF